MEGTNAKKDLDISFEKNQKKPSVDEKAALKQEKNPKDLYSQYNNFKWKEPDKIKNGPISDESRKCRDCICCIIFLIFFIGCIIIALLGFFMGNPELILYSYDEDGIACGKDDYQDYKLLYFYDVIGNIEKLENHSNFCWYSLMVVL